MALEITNVGLNINIMSAIVNVLRPKFATIDEAEENFGLSVDAILDGNPDVETPISCPCPSVFSSELSKLTHTHNWKR